MDVLEAIRQRRSIRGFKPDPVPKDVLQDILDVARYSPSSVNCQPWEVVVATGQLLDEIKSANVRLLACGAKPSRPSHSLQGKYRERQVQAGSRIYELMGITREDKAKRAAWREKGFRFYDAPAAILLATESSLEPLHTIFDMGLFAQTICLAALSHGLGTCIEGAGVSFAEAVRKITGLLESKVLVVAIAIGYPDWEFPANKCRTDRDPVSEFTAWLGFD